MLWQQLKMMLLVVLHQMPLLWDQEIAGGLCSDLRVLEVEQWVRADTEIPGMKLRMRLSGLWTTLSLAFAQDMDWVLVHTARARNLGEQSRQPLFQAPLRHEAQDAHVPPSLHHARALQERWQLTWMAYQPLTEACQLPKVLAMRATVQLSAEEGLDKKCSQRRREAQAVA